MDDIRRKKIGELIRQMERDAGSGSGDRPQRISMAQIQLELAEEQADSADKLERFTRWLVYLTFALFLLTAFLCYDGYSHRQSENLTHQSTTK